MNNTNDKTTNNTTTKKEKYALTLKDNPKLFEAVFFHADPQLYSLSQGDYLKRLMAKKEGFTQEELDDVCSLEFGKTTNEPLSLAGIEKLHNLRQIRVYTYSTDKVQALMKYQYDLIKDDPKEKLVEEIAKKGQKLLSTNQIVDLAPLYKCKGLETIDIPSQRNIVSFEMEHFPALRTLNLSNCENLSSVSGLETLDLFHIDVQNQKVFYSYPATFNFYECFNLTNIENFDKFVDILCKKTILRGKCKITLPTTTYCHLHNKFKDSTNALSVLAENEKRDLFTWTESASSEQASITLSTPDMTLLQMSVHDIVKAITFGADKKTSANTQIEKNFSGADLEEISRAYRWVVDHIHSDHLGSLKEEVYKTDMDLVNITRNSLSTINRKKAVCVGISNTLNLILAEMGYVARPCFCKESFETERKENKNDGFIFVCDLQAEMFANNHQISKIYLDLGNGAECYYMDPTWDVARKKSKYFLLNKEELQKSHRLSIGEKEAPTALSIQNVLDENKQLVSQRKTQNIARVVNKYSSKFGKYKAKAFLAYILAKNLKCKTTKKIKSFIKKEKNLEFEI